MGARYLDPKTGRFTQPDPVGLVNPASGKVNQKMLLNPQRLNKYTYGLNNPYRYVDSDGNIPLDTIWDIANVIYDIAVGDWVSLGADTIAMMIPYVPAGSTKLLKAGKASKRGTETVQRAMSRAELEATRKTGLLRGGREGTHYVSDAVNTTAKRARQRLGLPVEPEVRVTMEVPKGKFSPPSRVQPFEVQPGKVLPGGGMERTATGNIPVKILDVRGY